MNDHNDYFSVPEYLAQMQRIAESLSPVIKAVERIQTPLQEWADMYKNVYAPIQNMALGIQLSKTTSNAESISRLASALADNPIFREPQVMRVIRDIQSNSNLFSSYIKLSKSISIHDGRVVMPETFVANDNSSENLLSDTNLPTNSNSSPAPTKKMPLSDILSIINLLLFIFTWILSNHSPATWQEKYQEEIIQAINTQCNLLAESNRLQTEQLQLEEEQLQLEKERFQLEKEWFQLEKEQFHADMAQTRAIEKPSNGFSLSDEQVQSILEAIEHLTGVREELLLSGVLSDTAESLFDAADTPSDTAKDANPEKVRSNGSGTAITEPQDHIPHSVPD